MSNIRVGDWVEVRSKEEILATLDRSGRLDGMPFSSQMLRYCGKRFRVYKSAHKTCDPIYSMASRRVADGVHLNLRCDGLAYGGCQVGCLLFWKRAWLKPLGPDGNVALGECSGSAGAPRTKALCAEEDVVKSTRVQDGREGADIRYVCQATELPKFSTHLPWWYPGQYVEDYRSGNTTLGAMARGAFYATFVRYPTRLLPFRVIYNVLLAFIGGKPSPVNWGHIPVGQPQPNANLNLEAGDLVRIKSHAEILKTLDRRNKNRGLFFDVEMVPFCGGIYRVRTLLERFIDENTGKMRSLKTRAVILEGVFCGSHFSKRRMYCPRGLHSWWREVWLERVEEKEVAASGGNCAVRGLQAGARAKVAALRRSTLLPRDV